MKAFGGDGSEFASHAAETKAAWYSAAASSYESGRPDYPAELISEVIAGTNLEHTSRMLEIGSGPGTATNNFVQLGCAIECVEPNVDFVAAARRRFEKSRNVQIIRSAFEDYDNQTGQFDVIVAATSFHWLERDKAFTKCSSLLRLGGYLVLLWNKEIQPVGELGERIRALHERFDGGGLKFETAGTQIQALEGIGQWFEDRKDFRYLGFKHQISAVRYTAKRYLEALSSYSPYLAMPEATKQQLFAELADLIETDHGGMVDLQYVTGCHIGQTVA